MSLHEVRTDDIDELFTWSEDWDGRYWQLAAGPLGYRSVRARLPGMEILWQRLARPVLYEEALVEDRLVFNVLLRAAGPVRYQGREVRPGACALQPRGTEVRSVSARGHELLEISLSPALMQAIAPAETPDGLLLAEPRALKRIVRVCREVTLGAAGTESDGLGPRADSDRVLLALREVLARCAGSGAKSRGVGVHGDGAGVLVRCAWEIMDRHAATGALGIADLAAQLDVSERGLYAAFQQHLGIGPYTLQLVRRMHAVRDALLSGPYHPGKTAQAGREAGFPDASSLTRAYRRCFGESPRATLKRRGRL